MHVSAEFEERLRHQIDVVKTHQEPGNDDDYTLGFADALKWALRQAIEKEDVDDS